MKAYVCKYWETRGVFPMEGEISDDGRYFTGKWPHGYTSTFTAKEWDTDLSKAIGKASALRDKKLQSLRKHFDKVSRMTIKVEQ